ncbi:hypothetical protein [Streptomyces achromogenes]|uniref:hypothetical protein n=1 Tax=Streptomyces achromogenes TaxID=67255 RepID=UPI003702C210
MIVKKLHDMGVKSEHAYLAAFASIGFTVVSWAGSLKWEPGTDLARADRWGLFVGEWAPTFFGLGLALSHYEQDDGSLTGAVHPLREAG